MAGSPWTFRPVGLGMSFAPFAEAPCSPPRSAPRSSVLHAHLVRVEVEATRGPPFFELVGLAEAAVRESRVRVKSALAHVGVDIGECRVVVNLAPGRREEDRERVRPRDRRGGRWARSAPCRARRSRGSLFIGELSLEGTVQPLRGVLPQLLGARARGVQAGRRPARQRGRSGAGRGGRRADRRARCGELARARCAGGPSCPWPAVAAERPRGSDARRPRPTCAGRLARAARSRSPPPVGTTSLMIGPPGAGKTMLARRLPALLPPLSTEEALEVTAIHSVGGPPVGRRAALSRAPVSRAAPHRERGGARRRRGRAASGRGEPRAPRGALPRRAGGVPALGARGAAPAARGRRRHNLARAREGDVPGARSCSCAR